MPVRRTIDDATRLVDLMVDQSYGESVHAERTGHWRQDRPLGPDVVFERRLAYVLDGLFSLLEPRDAAR